MEIKEVEWDEPRANECLVRVHTTGVCHSDLHIMKGDLSAFTSVPMLLGHEGAGTVVQAGPGVTRLKSGDRVIFLFVPNCGICGQCQIGRPGNCQGRRATSGASHDGTFRVRLDGKGLPRMTSLGLFSEYVVVSAEQLVHVTDDEVPLDRCALVGCSVMTGVGAAMNTAKVEMGSTVAVVGCGGVGLNVIQGARNLNAATIIGIDLLDNKLEYAKQFGATHVINGKDKDTVAEVLKICPNGVDYAFDAIGNSKVLEQIFNMLTPGGSAIEVGVAPQQQMSSLSPLMLNLKELKILGSMYGSARPQLDMPRLLALYKQGRLKLDELISKTFTLEQINEGFEELKAGGIARGVIKM
ncbi:alcohol dehydrogenase zinc-binding domain-containing protein [Hyaloraphidium curvatum]|nr:alcohol dehydrogenase zinc-binding domain-containing protein [Hyaloraphidium curvatum]